jgi:hypothetical protein
MKPEKAAFDENVPQNERAEALAELQKSAMPALSDLMPREEVREVIDYIEGEYAMAKAIRSNIVPFPSSTSQSRKRGMQSVQIDQWQISVQGDYWERPSALGFDALRAMVDQTPVLSALIMTRVRQAQRFCRVAEKNLDLPGFEIRHIDKQHQITKSEAETIQKLNRFIVNCGWEFVPRKRKLLHRDSLSQFIAKAVRDSLVLDSVGIELEWKRDKSLGVDGFYDVDGGSIRLCTEEGYRGDDEIYALQVVQGRVSTAYTREDLIYEPRNPRSDVTYCGYGIPETELLIRVVTGFLNAMTYNIRGFDENALPKGVLHMCGDYTQGDVSAFKRYWNAMVRGVNNQWSLPVLFSKDQQSKASFEKFGIEFNEMYFSKWMTFLTSIICAIYGMSPAEINFDSFTSGNTSALSGSDTAEKLAVSKDSGLRPLLAYFENLFTDYLIQEFSEKFVFRWSGLDPADAQHKHELRKMILTLDEMRAEEGYEEAKNGLGDAPLNQTLIGPWLQLQQGAQENTEGNQNAKGDPGDDPDGGPDSTPRGGKRAMKKKDSDSGNPPESADIKSLVEDFDQLLGGKPLVKANPNHDERGRFASGFSAAKAKIKELIQKLRAGDYTGRAEVLLPVTDAVLSAGKLAGVDLEGYAHAADVYALQHVFKKHGGEAERARGQIPVTGKDLENIPEIVSSPDYVVFGIKNGRGREVIAYFKRMPDGTVLHLEEIREGKKQLALQSMRKYPATIDAAKVLTPTNLYARSDGGDELIIVDPEEGIKARFNRGEFGKPETREKLNAALTKSFGRHPAGNGDDAFTSATLYVRNDGGDGGIIADPAEGIKKPFGWNPATIDGAKVLTPTHLNAQSDGGEEAILRECEELHKAESDIEKARKGHSGSEAVAAPTQPTSGLPHSISDVDPLWAEHENPFVRELVEKFSRSGLDRIEILRTELLNWISGKYYAPISTEVPRPRGSGIWNAGELDLVKIYLQSVNPANMTLEDCALLVDYVIHRNLPESNMLWDAEAFAVRANLMGKVDAFGGSPDVMPMLPASVAAALGVFPLSRIQRATMEYGKQNCCSLVQSFTDDVRKKVKRAVLDHQQQKALGNVEGSLEQKLFDEFSEFNRDWRRIAVTEGTEMVNQGMVAAVPEGTKLKRLEMYAGACAWCQKIDGKIYTVVDPSKPDKDGETEVWAGKTNVGRSAAPRKKTADGLVDRTKEERYWCAAGAQHPNCRGRFIILSMPAPIEDAGFSEWLKNPAENVMVEAQAAEFGKAWDESLHPRDEAGKFSESGGGSVEKAEGNPEDNTGRSRNSDPVSELSGNELGIEEGENIRDAAYRYYETLRKNPAHRKGFGSVEFTRVGRNKLGSSSLPEPERLKLLPAVKPIIERGDYIGRSNLKEERKDGIVAFHYFEGNIKIGGKPKFLGVSVGEDSRGNKFYNLTENPDTLLAKKKARESAEDTARGLVPFGGSDHGSLD